MRRVNYNLHLESVAMEVWMAAFATFATTLYSTSFVYFLSSFIFPHPLVPFTTVCLFTTIVSLTSSSFGPTTSLTYWLIDLVVFSHNVLHSSRYLGS